MRNIKGWVSGASLTCVSVLLGGCLGDYGSPLESVSTTASLRKERIRLVERSGLASPIINCSLRGGFLSARNQPPINCSSKDTIHGSI